MQPQEVVSKVVPMPNLSTWLKDAFALTAQPEPLCTNSNKCYYLKSQADLRLAEKGGCSFKQRKKMGFTEINSKILESFALSPDAADGLLSPVVRLRR